MLKDFMIGTQVDKEKTQQFHYSRLTEIFALLF